MIRIENLRMEFEKGAVALDNINLEIEEGEFIALLGPSGCGKSTTLNCMAGLLDPTGGKVFFGNEDVTDKAPKDRNIGMCFQSYALYPHLTVLDNIAFPLKQKGDPKEERYEKARKIAEKLQISHLLERRPAQLSGGQQQRVAMCRALVKEPKVLRLDEPMSNLDARLKIEIREVIKKLQQELKVTSVIVTHDQEEAMAIADKIAILSEGRIQQYDTPDRLYEYPANLFVANFMGNPPMNFIDARIQELGGEVVLMVGEHPVKLQPGLQEKLSAHMGEEVEIGVRSHQAYMTEKGDNALEMEVTMVENLGKELLVTGAIHGNHMRLTVEETSLFGELRKRMGHPENPLWINFGTHLNVFGGEGKVNWAL